MTKNPLANAGDVRNTGLIPGSGRYPGEGNDNPLQYSGLENPTDSRAWRAKSMGCKELDMTEHLNCSSRGDRHYASSYRVKA